MSIRVKCVNRFESMVMEENVGDVCVEVVR